MSTVQSETAVDRVAAKRKQLGAEDFGAYAFLVLGMLAHQAPEVVDFLLNRADELTAQCTHRRGADPNGLLCARGPHPEDPDAHVYRGRDVPDAHTSSEAMED